MAESSDGTRYLVSDTLGRTSVRHVGKLQAEVGQLVTEMLAGLPTLGQRIRDARKTSVQREDAGFVLRGLGYGPFARAAVLARFPETAWELYHACCRHAKRVDVGEGTRLVELRRAQGILDPHRRSGLLEEGRLEALQETAAQEVVRVDSGQATLEGLVAA